MNEKTKSSPVLMRIRENLKAEKRLFLALLIMYMISLPLNTIMNVMWRKRFEGFYDNFISILDLVMLLSRLIIIVAILEGIVVCMDIFKYLHKRTEVDKVFSLPLSSLQRFKADFISGLIIYMVPYIISFVIEIVVGMIYDLELDTSIMFYLGRQIDGIPIWIYLFFIKLMFYAFCVFACVCCGNAVQTVTSIIVLNIAVPICLYAPICAIGQENPGYYPYQILGLLGYTSPAGGIFAIEEGKKINYLYSAPYEIVVGDTYNYKYYKFITWILSYIFVIIAIVLISAWFYKKRKAEDTGKPFAFSLFFYILSGMAIIAIFSYCYVEKIYIVGAVLSIMAFIILEFIRNKGFKKTKKFLLSMVYCVSVIGAVFIFITIGKSTAMFGMMKKIPEISDVKAIYVNSYFIGIRMRVNFDEEESKRMLLDFNQEIVDYCYSNNIENYSASVYEDETKSIVFTYIDNKWGVTNKKYYIRESMMDKFLYKLADIDEYRNEVCQYFNEYIDKSKANNDSMVLEILKHSSSAEFRLNDEKAEKLKTSFYSDVMSASADELIYNLDCRYRLEYFDIPESFSNTILALQECVR